MKIRMVVWLMLVWLLAACDTRVPVMLETDPRILRGTWEGTVVRENQPALTLKLVLQTKYVDESTYAISGTATLDTASFVVHGEGKITNGLRLVAQHSGPSGRAALMELLDPAGKTVWYVWNWGISGDTNDGVTYGSPKSYVGYLATENPKDPNFSYSYYRANLINIP
jgi:hypothetical protein